MNFEEYAPEANRFVKDVAGELGNAEDTDHAFRVMRSVFHTIRQILTPEESLHLVAQLPIFLKGLYVEEWHLNVKDRIRSMEEFLATLRKQNERSAARDFGNDETAIHKTKAVLNVIKRHVSGGEIQHMIDQFPVELAKLWLTEEKDVVKH